MSEDKLCPTCNKPITPFGLGFGANYSQYYIGFHPDTLSTTTPPPLMQTATVTMLATLTEQDLNKIRVIVREELSRIQAKQVHIGTPEQRAVYEMRAIIREEFERIVIEQEQRLNELFKQPVKHDGILDKNGNISVIYSNIYVDTDDKGNPLPARGMRILAYGQEVPLLAMHALSLLRYLQQEEQTLTKLAKEADIKVGDTVRVSSHQVAVPNYRALVIQQDGVLGVVCPIMYGIGSQDGMSFMALKDLDKVVKEQENDAL